jgi:hypothetical protein
MFEDLSRMTDFLSQAPYFISIAFGASFLLTLTAVKLAQSETVYQWFPGRREIMTARHARRIRIGSHPPGWSLTIASCERKLSPEAVQPLRSTFFPSQNMSRLLVPFKR